MSAVTVTTIAVSALVYLVLGGVSLGYGIENKDSITCSNPYFMTIEHWVFGLGIGHLSVGVLIIASAIIAFVADQPAPILVFGIGGLIYTFVYSILGALVLSVSKQCFLVKESFWVLALSDIVINFVFVVASCFAIPISFNE